MKNAKVLFFVFMITLMLCACGGESQEHKEVVAAIDQFASLTRGDLIEVKSGHVLYVFERTMNPFFIYAIPYVGAGENNYGYNPVSVSKCLVRIVKKGDADYDKVLLTFAKQDKWRSMK